MWCKHPYTACSWINSVKELFIQIINVKIIRINTLEEIVALQISQIFLLLVLRAFNANKRHH